ncbi:MAG: hypothetical protein HZB55_14125 [Deltaproteobacteria bacterium]|nr:hypothetical protein [Deltaproteobacteria bacterium]
MPRTRQGLALALLGFLATSGCGGTGGSGEDLGVPGATPVARVRSGAPPILALLAMVDAADNALLAASLTASASFTVDDVIDLGGPLFPNTEGQIRVEASGSAEPGLVTFDPVTVTSLGARWTDPESGDSVSVPPGESFTLFLAVSWSGEGATRTGVATARITAQDFSFTVVQDGRTYPCEMDTEMTCTLSAEVVDGVVTPTRTVTGYWVLEWRDKHGITVSVRIDAEPDKDILVSLGPVRFGPYTTTEFAVFFSRALALALGP